MTLSKRSASPRVGRFAICSNQKLVSLAILDASCPPRGRPYVSWLAPAPTIRTICLLNITEASIACVSGQFDLTVAPSLRYRRTALLISRDHADLPAEAPSPGDGYHHLSIDRPFGLLPPQIEVVLVIVH